MTNHHGHANVLFPVDSFENIEFLLPSMKFLQPISTDIAHYPVIYSYSILRLLGFLIVDPIKLSVSMVSQLVKEIFWHTSPAIFTSLGFQECLPTRSTDHLPASLSSDVLTINQLPVSPQNHQEFGLIDQSISGLSLAEFGRNNEIDPSGFKFDRLHLPDSESLTIETISSVLITCVALTVLSIHFTFLFRTIKKVVIKGLLMKPQDSSNMEVNIESDYYIEGLFELEQGGKDDHFDNDDAICDYTDDEEEEEEEEVPTKINAERIFSLYKHQMIQNASPGLQGSSSRLSSVSLSSSDTAAVMNGTVLKYSDSRIELLPGTDDEDGESSNFVKSQFFGSQNGHNEENEEENHDESEYSETELDEDKDEESDIESVMSDSVNINTNDFRSGNETEATESALMETNYQPSNVDSPQKEVSSGANNWTLDRSIKASLKYSANEINSAFDSTFNNTASWRFVNIDKEALTQRNNGFLSRCNVTGGSPQGSDLLSLFGDLDKVE